VTASAGRWYKEITKEYGATPTTDMTKLVSTEALKNYPERY
jgi:hypothetical protein